MTSADRQAPLAVYVGRTRNWLMIATTCAVSLPIVLMGMQSDASWRDPAFVIPVIIGAVAVVTNAFTASGFRSTAGPNGVTIRWGLVGWPRCTYRLDEIERVEVVDLPWRRVSFGLWWTPRRTNCTVRSGAAVRLTLRNHRIITMTVPEPAAAVTALHEAAGKPTGRVTVVAAHHDAELLTLKAQRKLQEADVIVHDRAVAPSVLELARRDAVRVPVNASATQIEQLMAAEARKGLNVVRLHDGVAKPLHLSGITVDVVPAVAPSAATADIVPFPSRHDIQDAILRAVS